MVTTARLSPLPLAVVVIGLAAFALGLATMAVRGPGHGAHAQDLPPGYCAQPNPDGCVLFFETPAQSMLNDPTAAHTWLIDVPDATDFYVAVANLPADLEVWVYGPDNSLLAQSNRPGLQDEIVRVNGAGAGTYSIIVDSPNGDSSIDLYTVLATTSTLVLEPFDAYGVPSQYILPY